MSTVDPKIAALKAAMDQSMRDVLSINKRIDILQKAQKALMTPNHPTIKGKSAQNVFTTLKGVTDELKTKREDLIKKKEEYDTNKTKYEEALALPGQTGCFGSCTARGGRKTRTKARAKAKKSRRHRR